ncbi:endogenous retrovirus group K member 24 Gag polyprotein-like [Pitangus sulphuratus]|nr:endogenous retrovirus group K member 24 Gag polyprotein-like [Pitangus sulphuratus]
MGSEWRCGSGRRAELSGGAKREGRSRREAREISKARETYVREQSRPQSPVDTPSSASSTSSIVSSPPDCLDTYKGRVVRGTSSVYFRKRGSAHNRYKVCSLDSLSHDDVWKVCKAQAVEKGDAEFLKAFPVFYDNPERHPEWVPISYPILRDIKKSVVEYGLGAPFTLGLFDSLFQAYTLIPYDIRVITKGLLTTVQNSVFENEWKNLITKHVNDKLPRRQAPTDHLINVMYGEGPFANRKQQIGIKKEYLDISRDLALQAIKKVADAYASAPSFTMIHQGQDESFIDFISRLKEAIVKQVDQKESQDILFQKLAIENANEECQRALKYLKNPSIVEMIEACKNINSNTHKAKLLAAALSGPNTRFHCHQKGHVMKQCPQLKGKNSNTTALPKTPCLRCGKGRHWTKDCKSVTDIHGNPLPPKSPSLK